MQLMIRRFREYPPLWKDSEVEPLFEVIVLDSR